MRRVEYTRFAQVLEDPTEIEEAHWVVVIDRKTGIAYSGFPFQGEWMRDDVSNFVGASARPWPAKKSV